MAETLVESYSPVCTSVGMDMQLRRILAAIRKLYFIRHVWHTNDICEIRKHIGSAYTTLGSERRKMITTFMWRALNVTVARRMMSDPVLVGPELLWIQCPTIDTPLAVLHTTMFVHTENTQIMKTALRSAPPHYSDGIFVGCTMSCQDSCIVPDELQALAWNCDEAYTDMLNKRHKLIEAIDYVSLIIRKVRVTPRNLDDIEAMLGRFCNGYYFKAMFAREYDVDDNIVPQESLNVHRGPTFYTVCHFAVSQSIHELFDPHSDISVGAEILRCHAASIVRNSSFYRFFIAVLRAWRPAISNPNYKLCQVRLQREALQLIAHH